MKKRSLNNRVLQSVHGGSITYNDYDLKLTIDINIPDRTKAGAIIVKTNNVQDFIGCCYLYGENDKKIKLATNTKQHSKNLNVNEDDNGAGNGSNFQIVDGFYYIANPESVQEIEIAQTASGVQSVSFIFRESFSSLKTLNFKIQIGNIDFSFLSDNAFLKKITFNTWLTKVVSNLSALKSSNLRWLSMSGFAPAAPLNQILANLPSEFIYFSVYQWETQTVNLSEYFTGNRHALVLTDTAINKIYYTGNVFFPTIIQDEVGIEIPQILNIALRTKNNAGNANGARNLTPLENAKLLMDFANQVTAVNIVNSSAKKITLYGSADSTYIDNTQPNFKTYTSALNHINSTLGVTVNFLTI